MKRLSNSARVRASKQESQAGSQKAWLGVCTLLHCAAFQGVRTRRGGGKERSPKRETLYTQNHRPGTVLPVQWPIILPLSPGEKKRNHIYGFICLENFWNNRHVISDYLLEIEIERRGEMGRELLLFIL